MKWGIVVEWDERGLACCEWLQRTSNDTMDDPREFVSAADAQSHIQRLTAGPYPFADLTPQAFAP